MHNLWANAPKSISTFFFFPALIISFTPFDLITLNTTHIPSVLQAYYQDRILSWGCKNLAFFISFFLIDMFSSVEHNFEALQFILQSQSVLFILNWTYIKYSPLMSKQCMSDFQLLITNLNCMFSHPPMWLLPKAPTELKVYFIKTSWLYRSICCKTSSTGKFSRLW